MSAEALSIIEVCESPALFAPWFKNRKSWSAWFIVLKVLFGLPVTDSEDLELFRRCTGRSTPPPKGSDELWLVVGRRGGKSLILALIAVYLACFRDWSGYLTPGESGVIRVIAVDKKQARVIARYCRALVLKVPVLAALVESIDSETIMFTSGIVIEVSAASFRSLRGSTLIAALCDEIAFWRTDDESANPDSEILAAIRPAMSTIPNAMLLCASSPYSKRGVLYAAFRENFGHDDAPALVWKAPTDVMNPTVPANVIAQAYARDPANAAAEYGAEFRSDIDSFVIREVVDAAVVPSRYELPRLPGTSYVAFVDPSGGSADSFTLAIAHRERDGRAILDAVRERRPPFSPEAVVEEFAVLLKNYGVHNVFGDRYAGEWPRERFRKSGITYVVADAPKSDLYRDALPMLNSGKVELLDHPRLCAQLCALERRTARSGKDSIDHAPGAHDDIANCAAGALVLAAGKRRMVITDELLRSSEQPDIRRVPKRVPVYF